MSKRKRPGPRRILRRPGGPTAPAFAIWQADFRPTPHWIKVAGRPVRPWLVLVTSRSADLVLAHEIAEDAPSADLVWDVLTAAMTRPAAGVPHRPSELQVRPDQRWNELEPRIVGLGITLVRTNELDQLDGVLSGVAAEVGGDTIPCILDMPGITPERAASFYRTASRFYRLAPWRKLGDDMAIKVECSRFQSGPWYAVMMGQAGMTFGLTLYDDLETLQSMWEGEMSDEEGARTTVALTVTFDDETGVPLADLDAARKYGWEVAGPAAYPWIFRKEPGLSVRPPLAWEMELMEGCLHAVPTFIAQHSPYDGARHEMKVPMASSDLSLTLSWVE